jgi:outer membrane autotransporter protein
MRITNPVAGLADSPLSGSAVAFNTSVGYHYNLPQNWFLEPSLAFIYNRLSVDTLSYGALGSQSFNTVLSELGRAGLRVGTTYTDDKIGVSVQPFAVGSIWHEFASNSTSNYIAPGGASDTPLSVSRIGTFGQVSLGLSAQILNTGLAGFVRGDYRFGQNIQGYTAVGGMRYEF